MRPKAFFGGLSRLLVLNLLVKPAWIFLIDRQVQNAVGHEAYGRYFALFNLSYVLLFVADAGLTGLLTQSVAAGAAVHVPQLLRAKMLLLLLYASLCFFTGWLTGVQQATMLFYLVLIQSLSSLFVFLRGLLTAAQFFKTDALFSVLDKTLMLVLCAGPVYGLISRINVNLFLQLQLTATAVSAIGLLLFCLRKNLFSSAAQKQSTRALAKSATPFLLIVLLMATHYRLDGFLLERLHGDGARQAGIYASAYRLSDAGNMIGYLCASFLVPFLARHRQERKTIGDVVLFVRHGLALCAVTAVVAAFVFAPWLQEVLYHTGSAYNNRIIALCVGVLPAYYLVHVYGSLLTAVGAYRLFISILIFSVLVNAVLNVILIPSLGAAGCCMAALVSQYGCALSLWFFASRTSALPLAARWAAFYAGWGAACWLLFSAVKNSGTAVWIILAVVCFAAITFTLTQKARLKRIIALINS